MDSTWMEKMSLKEDLYYQVRFPEDGLLMEYTSYQSDSFYNQIAQFTPYVVRNGKMQTIHLIYCNNRIVFFKEASPSRRYVFVGAEGYNNIQIRTTDALYTIDSVFLKKGEKLELSLDEYNYKKSTHQRFISKSKKREKKKESCASSISPPPQYLFSKWPTTTISLAWTLVFQRLALIIDLLPSAHHLCLSRCMRVALSAK